MQVANNKGDQSKVVHFLAKLVPWRSEPDTAEVLGAIMLVGAFIVSPCFGYIWALSLGVPIGSYGVLNLVAASEEREARAEEAAGRKAVHEEDLWRDHQDVRIMPKEHTERIQQAISRLRASGYEDAIWIIHGEVKRLGLDNFLRRYGVSKSSYDFWMRRSRQACQHQLRRCS